MSIMIARLAIIISLVGLVALFLVYKLKFSGSTSAESSIFTAKKKKHVHTSNYDKLYNNLENMFGVKGYTRKIRGVFEMYFPGDERLIKELTVKMVVGIFTFLVASIVIVLMLKPTVYMLFCTVVLVYVINDQVVHYIITSNEAKMLLELDNFIELLQFNFLQNSMIDEALHDCMIGKNKLIERHVQKILDVIQSENMEDALYVYNATVRNNFLKELMCICVTVFQYGDTKIDGRSSFLDNLKRLKDRIGSASVDNNELKYNFMMLPILCVIPLFAAQFLKDWAISMIPELEAYFNGYYGFIVTIVCAVVSIVSYVLVNALREDGMVDLSDHAFLQWISDIPFIHGRLVAYYNSNYGKELQISKLLRQLGSRLTVYTLAIKRMLFAVIAFVVTLSGIYGFNTYMRYHITSHVTGTGSKSSAASEEESIVMMLLIKGYTTKYLDYNAVDAYNEANGTNVVSLNDAVKSHWEKELINDIESGNVEISDEDAMIVIQQYNEEHSTSTNLYTAYLGTTDGAIRDYDEDMINMANKQLKGFITTAESPSPLSLPIFESSVTDDVIEAVTTYQNSYVHWYHVFVCVLLSCIAFMIPYVWLLYNKRSMQFQLQSEVMQFHALVMILMPVKGISAQTILDWMLIFSNVFHKSIHTCTIKMTSAEKEAFDGLIAAEPYEPFRDLVRKLQMCDKVGVASAFATIGVTRNNYVEKSKQESKHRAMTNSALAVMIVYIPVIVIFALFLAVPFLSESFGQLNTTLYEMTQM